MGHYKVASSVEPIKKRVMYGMHRGVQDWYRQYLNPGEDVQSLVNKIIIFIDCSSD